MKSRRYTKSVFTMESANCATKVAMILGGTHTRSQKDTSRWCMNKSCATDCLMKANSSGGLVKAADARATGRWGSTGAKMWRTLAIWQGGWFMRRIGRSCTSMASPALTITKENHPLFHLAAIQYDRTSGRYDKKRYTLYDVELWHNMDDVVSVDCDMPEVPRDQVLDNANGNGSGTNQDDNYANESWWPVLLCQLPVDDPGAFQTMVPDYLYVMICFYQVLDTPLWAWTIEFW